MKKLIPGLLALALLLSACGGPAAEETPTPAPEPTPTQTAEPTPTPEPTPVYSGVHTDWSKLEPYQPVQAVYTRRYEGFTDTLIPAEDYGPLIPFVGTKLTVGEELAGMYDEGFDLYGLVTLEGEVVMDPVLTSVLLLEEYDSTYYVVSQPKVMLLGKTVYDGEGHPEGRYALCAIDGSWCTDFLYKYSWEITPCVTFSQGVPLETGDGTLAFLDPDTGNVLRTLDLAAQVGTRNISPFAIHVDDNTGWTSVSLYYWGESGENGSISLLFDPDGKAHALPAESWWAYQYGDGLVPVFTGDHRYGYVDAETGEWAIQPKFTEAETFINGVAPVMDEDGIYFINTKGESLTEYYPLTGSDRLPIYRNGCWYVSENYNKIKVVLDEKLNPVESPFQGADVYIFMARGWGYDETQTERTDTWNGDVRGGLIYVPGEEWTTLTDKSGNVVFRWPIYPADD